MLSRYVAVSGDRSILTRALPLAEVSGVTLPRVSTAVPTNTLERAHLVVRQSILVCQEPLHEPDAQGLSLLCE